MLCNTLVDKEWMTLNQTSFSSTQPMVENTIESSDEMMTLPPLTSALNTESTFSNISIYWERREFEQNTLLKDKRWPDFITHNKLELVRNRFPVVPGFSFKTLDDENAIPPAPMKRKKGYAITRADKKSKRADKLNLGKRKRILVPIIEKAQFSGKTWVRKSRAAGDLPGASMPNGTRKPSLNDTLRRGTRRPKRILDTKQVRLEIRRVAKAEARKEQAENK